MNSRVTVFMFALVLVGCGPADYPKDWPKPASNWFARKGNCPDLAGDYDQVNSELVWLLGSNPDFERPRAAWQEQRVVLTQAEDGSAMSLQFSLNERGLVEFRDRTLRYNQEGVGGPRIFEFKRGEDYDCRGGWLHSLHFPQSEMARGMRRVSLVMARDRSGALIAGATLSQAQSIGWGDSPGLSIGNSERTRWYRWPARPRTADTALASLQSVTWHRYDWINHGTSVPTRFTSFYLEPICLRFFQGTHVSAPSGPELRRGRDDKRPSAPQCPDGWGKFDTGEVLRRELRLSNDDSLRYRIEWFVLSQGPVDLRTLEVTDVRLLPLMPEE